jgi:hypothetical protein
MPKMTDAVKREAFIRLHQNKDELNSDEQLVCEEINERLRYVPHKKLYKFRKCSPLNFRTLEENCIWMAPGKDFHDPMDSTINIDFKRNGKQIEAWLKDNHAALAFAFAKSLCEKLGVEMPYSYELFLEYAAACLDTKGVVNESKEADFLRAHAIQEELQQMDQLLLFLQQARQKLNQQEEDLTTMFADAIENMRTAMRNKSIIYCMTEGYDNSSLWENYADTYKGFCIEYSFDKFDSRSFEEYKVLTNLFPMSYRVRKPYFNMVPFIEGFFRQLLTQDTSWQQDSAINADLNMQLYYKRKEYEFEHEWRFAISDKFESKQPFPFVSALYAGKDIKPGNLRRLCSVALKLNVPVYRQALNRTNNGFIYEIVQEANR